VANPAERLGRHLRLVATATARQEEIKAMTRKQLASFLGVSATAAKEYERSHYGLFLLLARTGMRLGEALALQWEDVDFPGREIRVARALSAGRIETPKSDHGRTVDMSNQLAGSATAPGHTQGGGTQAWVGALPAWVFCTEEGTSLDESRVRKVLPRRSRQRNCRATSRPTACVTPMQAFCSSREKTQPTFSVNSGRPQSNLPSIPTAAGCPPGTRRRLTDLTTQVVA
jgi:site-specific recombinase XerD